MTDINLWPDSPEWPRKWPRDDCIDAETTVGIVRGYARRTGMDAADERLLLVIAEHLPYAFPSIDRLAELTGSTYGSTRRRLRKLQQKGVIERIDARFSRPSSTTTLTLTRITIPRLHRESKMHLHRACEHCGKSIPPHLKKGTKYCKPSHQVAAAKKRAKARRAQSVGMANTASGYGE